MREALKVEKGWADQDLPCEKVGAFFSNMLNRLGYRLRQNLFKKQNQSKK